MKTNKIINDISSILRDRGISVYRLSKLTGIHQSTIHRILNKEINPKLSTLESIADALDLKIKILKN